MNEPDYFGQVSPVPNGNGISKEKPVAEKEGPTEGKEEVVSSPTEETPAKKGKGMFGKKFTMGFNMKKFSTGTAIAEPAKPTAVDEKAEDSDAHSSKTDEKAIEDSFYGSIQRIRQGYEEQLAAGAKLETQITPSLPNDTPVLKPPANTTILIQEDRPDAGGVADLFEGKVGSLATQADLIEKVAPMWLAEVLLRVGHPSPLPFAHPLTSIRYTELPPPERHCQSVLHPRAAFLRAPQHSSRRVPPLLHTLRPGGTC